MAMNDRFRDPERLPREFLRRPTRLPQEPLDPGTGVGVAPGPDPKPVQRQPRAMDMVTNRRMGRSASEAVEPPPTPPPATPVARGSFATPAVPVSMTPFRTPEFEQAAPVSPGIGSQVGGEFAGSDDEMMRQYLASLGLQ